MEYPTSKLNIVINQGATFYWELDIKAEDGSPIIDIQNADLRGQLRTSYSSAAVAASFTFTWLDNNGKSTMEMAAATTAGIAAGDYVYDVELFWAGTGVVWRLFEGKARVTPEVTK